MKSATVVDALDRIVATGAELPACTLSPAAFLALHPNATELSDERRSELFLTSACLQGDRVALAEFFGRFTLEVRAVGRRSLPQDELDDFVQEVWARLLVARGKNGAGADRFEGRGPLLAFVRITASRTAIDLLRRRGVRKDQSTDGDCIASTVRETHGDSQTPERQLVSDHARSVLGRVLAEVMADLALHERRALRMRYLLGFSVARTARALHLHERSVSRLVGRLTVAISRKTLERLGPEEGTWALERVAMESSIGAWLASQPAPA